MEELDLQKENKEEKPEPRVAARTAPGMVGWRKRATTQGASA